MQGWVNFIKWAALIFMEEKDAYHAKRNHEDPAQSFFENQITFLDCYVIG